MIASILNAIGSNRNEILVVALLMTVLSVLEVYLSGSISPFLNLNNGVTGAYWGSLLIFITGLLHVAFATRYPRSLLNIARVGAAGCVVALAAFIVQCTNSTTLAPAFDCFSEHGNLDRLLQPAQNSTCARFVQSDGLLPVNYCFCESKNTCHFLEMTDSDSCNTISRILHPNLVMSIILLGICLALIVCYCLMAFAEVKYTHERHTKCHSY